jgi:hypothetical protein
VNFYGLLSDHSDVDVVVIALKIRTIAPGPAIAQSLEALNRLKTWGCHQYYFKYCSTFDSTEKGSIGPVRDALLDALRENFTIADIPGYFLNTPKQAVAFLQIIDLPKLIVKNNYCPLDICVMFVCKKFT